MKMSKLCVLLLLLLAQLSYSVGEKYTSIVVSKQVDEKNGTISMNISVLYFNTSRIEIPQGPGEAPKIVEQTNITSIENATVYISFYNTSYSEEGKLLQTLSPLPCSPITANKTYEENSKVVYYGECVINGELYSKYFNNTCRGLDFYFPGIVLPRESIPPTETTTDVCTGKPTIFEALRGIFASAINPEDPFCISMFIIFGLLLATLFFTGRSPLALLDMVTPILPKPRRFAYTAGLHTIGHKKMREDAAKVMGALDKEIKNKEGKTKIPDNLRSLYNSAEPWKKLLALRALKEGDAELAERLLRSDSPFTIAYARWGENATEVKKAYEYYLMKKMLDAYDEMYRVSKNKYVNKVLKLMGKQYLSTEIPAALQATAMTSRFVKRAVKAPFVRYGELKRVKAVEKAATPQEKRAAMAELVNYRKEKEIKPVNRLFDPLVYGEESYRILKEQAGKELMAYMLLRAFDRAGIIKKEIDRIFNKLKTGIAQKDVETVKKACEELESIITKIDNIDPHYKNIIERIRSVYSGEGDPYAKVFGVLSILEKDKIIVGGELAELKRYIRELSSIDRKTDLMDIQKFLNTASFITDYRERYLPYVKYGWHGFIPALFTPESERKSISNVFSMLFANEVLSQKADLSAVARFFFGMRAINPLFPLMEYHLLPSDFKGWVKEQKLDGVYKEISSFSSRMFDELVGRTFNLTDKNAIQGKITDLMKEKYVENKFALLGKGVFGSLNTAGDWHVSSPHPTVLKVPRITASAFGRALELCYVGRVKENFENAFENEAFILPFSYYSVVTKNLVNDYAFQLAATGYYSMRYHVAKKLGMDVNDLTDDMFKRFMSNKKNLDLYLADFDKGSFILMKGWGVIPFVQDVLNPDPSKLDRYFVDKKIRDYIENKLGYRIMLHNIDVYSKLVTKGGIGIPDSFINTSIIVSVDGKWRLWKGQELSESDLYKLDSKLLTKGEIQNAGDFVKLYQAAAGGDESAFSKVKAILIKNDRMDAFMSLANAYQMSAKDVARQYVFTGITQNHVRYLPMEEARNVVQDWRDRTRLWVERGISGAVKPILYAGVPYFDAVGTVVAASEMARRLGVEYVGGLKKEDFEKLTKEERKIEESYIKAIKDFEFSWAWTITRDALLYGGFERYGRPGYLTTGFHVGPAMPLTQLVDRRAFSPFFQGIRVLDKVMQNIPLTTYRLTVGFSRPFVLGARAFGFHRYRYPSVYDIRSDIHESNPFVATQAYYPVYSTLPGISATLLFGLSSLMAPLLAPVGFFREWQERRELPIRGKRTGRFVEAIKNSIMRAAELKFVHPVDIRRLGIANSDIYVGAPRLTDTYWFYSPAMANIGDSDTNPGLSYIQSYTGNYVWQPTTPRFLERKGFEVLPRVREQMFDVHEKRTLSALGMAAFYYTEIHWADPFNFKNNPLYSILSPGTALLSAGAWAARWGYRKAYKREIKREEEEYRRLHPPSTADPNLIKMGGVTSFNAIRDWIKGRSQRWFGWLTTCPACGTRYYGPGPCPRCGRRPT